MFSGFTTFVVAVLAALISLPCAAAGKRPAELWGFFHFDGREFVAGKSPDAAPSVGVRPGMRPVLLLPGGKPDEVPLASGTGALVGICYQQSSGGKLKALQAGPHYAPVERLPVQISSGERVVATTETDANGFFLITLPAGQYRVSSRQVVEVTVTTGNTTLIPLRVGKRMVD